MKRRTFLCQVGLAASAAWAGRRALSAADATRARHLPGQIVSAPAIPLPAGKREPFGWKTVAVAGAARPPLILSWPELAPGAQPTHFRLAVGLDERDEKTIEVFLPRSGRILGAMELRFASQFQLYALALGAADLAGLRQEGLGLRLVRGSELEVFSTGENLPAALRPHLLVPGTADPTTEYLARMESLACVQPFGWMEGCVLDGLLDLGAVPAHAALRATARQHLALFFRGDRLVYENHQSVPSDGRIYGIEGSLPFAALARMEPQSPLLDLAVQFWRGRRGSGGCIQDGPQMTSEGAYTVGYALAEVARARKSEELMQLALEQVRLRQAGLFDGKEFWRTRRTDGVRGNRNWARGIAWQILGLARTLTVARDRADLADLVAGLRELAAWVMRLQRPDGLWSVFADEPSLVSDTGGSAGIGAALALGARQGWLGGEARQAAERTLAGLRLHLTSDGFLGGVSQSNKGGEALQRGGYRCIYQMGMGLQAQLMAALSRE